VQAGLSHVDDPKLSAGHTQTAALSFSTQILFTSHLVDAHGPGFGGGIGTQTFAGSVAVTSLTYPSLHTHLSSLQYELAILPQSSGQVVEVVMLQYSPLYPVLQTQMQAPSMVVATATPMKHPTLTVPVFASFTVSHLLLTQVGNPSNLSLHLQIGPVVVSTQTK